MRLFDEIKIGLEQAIEYEKGNLKAKKTTLSVLPLDNFTPIQIKKIRNDAGLTQALFAQYMGVSIKTIEAWEAGKNQPDGAARRLLAITRENPAFPTSSGIVAR